MSMEMESLDDRDAYYLTRVQEDAGKLADTLRAATEAGVSHAVILPQLVIVFRDAFGEMPDAVGELLAAAAQAP